MGTEAKGTNRSVFVIAAAIVAAGLLIAGAIVLTSSDDEQASVGNQTSPALAESSPTTQPELSPTTPPAITESPAVAAEAEEPPYPFKGYPKVVPASQVPSQMQDYVEGPKVLAVAPGVWTTYIRGVPLQTAVEDGAYYGYCAAVKDATRKLNNHSGSTCW